MHPRILSSGAALALALAAIAVPAQMPLQTVSAEYRDEPRELRLDGTVEAVKRATVSAQTKGQIVEVLFDVHDYVEKDAVIVRLRDTEQQAEVSRAEAALQEAQARLREARDSQKRIKELAGRQLASRADLDKAVAQLSSAQARSDAAEADLAKAREQLEYTRVRAPYSGIVTERKAEVGESVQPGQPLMTGLSLDELRVNVAVPQSSIQAVRASGKARVILPGGGSVEATKVTVFPYAEPGSNSFNVRLELPPGTAGLLPGMFVKAVFPIGTEKRLLVPAGAVVYRSEVTAVYVVRPDGSIGFRHIRVGRQTPDGMISVLSGLDPGERVALDPIAAGVELKRHPVPAAGR
jgi:RND family efflux transporter MFP subunit